MLQIGSVQLATNLMLAPLAGYTDLAFRLVVRQADLGMPGLGLAFTELLCSSAILHDATRTLWMASTCAEDQPIGMQLYGRDPQTLAQAAQWAQDHGATLIDINMGCPVDKITKTNGGSKLLCEPELAVEIARHVVRSVRVPVTTKIRLGWDDSCLIGPSLGPRLADVGVAALTVHGRTTEQLFSGKVRLEGIADVVAAMKKHHPAVPVIGNGDVKTAADAKRMMDVTGCDGVMIGRGALGKPWIFREVAHYLKTGELPPAAPRVERAKLVMAHFEHLVRLRDERFALKVIRQRISWYSAELQPWPGLRRHVREVQTAQGLREYMEWGMEEMRKREGMVDGRMAIGGV